MTSFGCGPTDRNSYVFAWTNAVIGRVSREAVANAETIDASIELFRNGDIAITTNGVTELRPRELPFPRDGYGQDDEWVTANFTNATEILAVGYPQWVDAQVGEGLTNGLYKFTATVPDDPPETIQLVVGDYSVAVTNAGEYVFLLEKGVERLNKLTKGWGAFYSVGYPSKAFNAVNGYALRRMARFLNRKSQRYYRLKFADTYYGELNHYGMHYRSPEEGL